MLYDDKVILSVDRNLLSGVNHEAFVDQQEWLLYKHVDTEQRFVKEFLLKEGDEDEEEGGGAGEDRKRPVLTVTCHAGLYFIKDNIDNIRFFPYYSSSFKLFLLERILPYFSNYSCVILHLWNSSEVSYLYLSNTIPDGYSSFCP